MNIEKGMFQSELKKGEGLAMANDSLKLLNIVLESKTINLTINTI